MSNILTPQELRIGNWLQYDNKYFQVYDIYRDDDWDLFEPIPLTPEILEKAGFLQSETNIYWRRKEVQDLKFDISINTEGSIHIYRYKKDLSLPFVVRYVHQLQNLYYILTGRELEINL